MQPSADSLIQSDSFLPLCLVKKKFESKVRLVSEYQLGFITIVLSSYKKRKNICKVTRASVCLPTGFCRPQTDESRTQTWREKPGWFFLQRSFFNGVVMGQQIKSRLLSLEIQFLIAIFWGGKTTKKTT